MAYEGETMTYEDILYDIRGGAAWITINRAEKYNAFRGQTVDELIHAFQTAGWDRSVGVIVLTGAGDKAFCTGGDQSAHDGQYDGRGVIGLPIDELQSLIRDVPKPVIARVNGFAIGGGNVLATICDLTIASGEGAVRAGRTKGRLGRSGVRHRLSRARGGREKGAGDLVSQQALHGAGSACHGIGERGCPA